MPVISVFFGIMIRMYHADHAPPHFHAMYGDHDAIVEIVSGRIIAGHLPPRVRSLVEEWRRKRVSELKRAWQDAQNLKAPRRIKPLE